jgi:hypothetical protein
MKNIIWPSLVTGANVSNESIVIITVEKLFPRLLERFQMTPPYAAEWPAWPPQCVRPHSGFNSRDDGARSRPDWRSLNSGVPMGCFLPFTDLARGKPVPKISSNLISDPAAQIHAAAWPGNGRHFLRTSNPDFLVVDSQCRYRLVFPHSNY